MAKKKRKNNKVKKKKVVKKTTQIKRTQKKKMQKKKQNVKVATKKQSQKNTKKAQVTKQAKKTQIKLKQATKQVPKKEEKVRKLSPETKTLLKRSFAGAGIAIVVVGLTLLCNFLITSNLNGKSYNSTYFWGSDIGYLDKTEVEERVASLKTMFYGQPILINYNNETQEFTSEELGIQLNTEEVIAEVDYVDHYTPMYALMYRFIHNKHLSPRYKIDLNKAQKSIETKFNLISLKPQNAHYKLNEEGEVYILPEKNGEVVDRDEVLQLLESHVLGGWLELSGPAQISLIEKKPLISYYDLELEKDKISQMLDKGFTLKYEGSEWDFVLSEHIEKIEFDYDYSLDAGLIKNAYAQDGLQNDLQVRLNEDRFDLYIDETIGPEIEDDPENVSIYMDENEQVIIEGKGRNGKKIIRDEFKEAVEVAINGDVEEVIIPVYEETAKVTVSAEMQDLGIKELLGTGVSQFAGSTYNRIHNINVGIDKYNGMLVAPGEEFAFNEHLGPVDASGGFVQELVIKAEGTIPEYGGGLCQVSSTFFRAILWSGLPIVERTNHSYAVSYYSQIYGYGLDATIYPGIKDVRSINDTPGYILIQSYTEGNRAYFKFYGTSDGRSVEMEGPYSYNYRSPGPTVRQEVGYLAPGQEKWMEGSHTGFDVSWYRYLTKDGETVKEHIFSNYKAIPAKVLVGPSVAPAEGGGE